MLTLPFQMPEISEIQKYHTIVVKDVNDALFKFLIHGNDIYTYSNHPAIVHLTLDSL